MNKLPIEEGVTELYSYESKSSPGTFHTTFYSKALGFYCTCQGFSSYHHCWHIIDTLEKIKLEYLKEKG